MASKMNWSRARKPKPAESVLGEGVEMRNGTRTPVIPKDSLAARAKAAERSWMRGLTGRSRALARGE